MGMQSMKFEYAAPNVELQLHFAMWGVIGRSYNRFGAVSDATVFYGITQ
jgi:hypothetical protein